MKTPTKFVKPCVSYAWQLVGERLELASTHGPRQNALGFFNLRQQFHSLAFEGSIDTHAEANRCK